MGEWSRRSFSRAARFSVPIFSVIPQHVDDHSLRRLIRAGDWWQVKIAPTLGVAYLTAYALDTSVVSLWRAFVLALVALAPGAAFVSLINDITDLEEDRAAGKPNQVAGRSRLQVGALLAGSIVAGIGVSLWFRHDRVLLPLYLSAWLVFTLYSARPFRLKSRGLAGVVVDAAGAHLFPTMLAAVLVFREAGRELRAVWLVPLAVWALAWGLRGIIGHQLNDASHDHATGVRTFVQRHPGALPRRLVTFGAFPLEAAAMAALLWRIRHPLVLLALVAYAVVVANRFRHGMRLDVLQPRPGTTVILNEFYSVLLPPAALLASATREPLDLLALAVHCAVFPAGTRQALGIAVRALSQLLAPARRGIGAGRQRSR